MDKPEIVKVVEEAQFIYISSFFLTVPEGPESLLQVAKHVQASENKKFMMNLAAEFLMQFFQDKFQVALQYCDVVFGNELEATAYATKVGLPDPSDRVATAQALANAPKVTPGSRLVVITQGADPTIVVQDGVTRTFPVPKLAKSKIVDTNGAGDSFVGGFLAQYMRGASIPIAVQSGTVAARNCIQQSGCKLGQVEESVFQRVLTKAAHDGVEIDEISVAFTLGFHAGTAKKLENAQ